LKTIWGNRSACFAREQESDGTRPFLNRVTKIHQKKILTMKTKKFTVQYEWDERTRWLFDAGKSRETLECLAGNIAKAFTTGAIPAVTVIIEEERTPLKELRVA
jgi:hypothetical protein